jgi:arylsulfatase
MIDHVYLLYAGQALVANFLGTFMKYPPRMKPASFAVDQIMKKMEATMAGAG